MDDFVTKPVVPSRLYATMVKWMGRSAGVGANASAGEHLPTQPGALLEDESPFDVPQAPEPTLPSPPEALDLSVLTQLTRGNSKMMREIATVFLAFMERTMNELDAALLAGDRARLSALGHKAKSSAAAVGAMGLSGLCHGLESSMKDPSASLDQAHRLVADIRAQMVPISEKFARVLA